MQREQVLEAIIQYVKSNDYLCDVYNDYAQAQQEMCEYDWESEHSYINRRSKAYAQREANRQGFHFKPEELDYHFPSMYVDFPSTQLSLPKASQFAVDYDDEGMDSNELREMLDPIDSDDELTDREHYEAAEIKAMEEDDDELPF